jgi:ankyrin repeat protein
VRALIELGADVNQANDYGTTPLYTAAEKGHEAIVRALIDFGADVNKANNNGWTPLYMAARDRFHHSVIKILTDAGAV